MRAPFAVVALALPLAALLAWDPAPALSAAVHVPAMLAVAAVLAWRWRVTEGRAGRVWGLLALSAALHAHADLARHAGRLLAGEDSDPAAVVVLELSAHVPLVAALVLAMAPAAAAALAVLPEVAALGTVTLLAVWQTLVHPGLHHPPELPAARLALVTHPLLDALLLVIVVWLVAAWGRLPRAGGWLLAATAVPLAGDALVLLGPGHPSHFSHAAALGLIGVALLAAAALAPGAADGLGCPDRGPAHGHGRARLVILVGTLLAAPALIATAPLVHDPGARAAQLIVAGAVSVLAAARVAALVRRLDRAQRASREAEQRLEHIAAHDVLTGLPNRRLLVDRLENALSRVRRQRRMVAVLFLDLDRFKEINDAHGHRAGDRLLVQTAERLQSAVRDGDTVARLGGDEFVVVCPDVPGAYEAVIVAERILRTVARPYDLDGVRAEIATSIGVALVDDKVPPDDLLRDADRALYEAKQSGRGRYCVYDERLRAQVAERRERERVVRRALENGDIRPLYAPEVSLETGATDRLRAELRFDVPGGRMAEGAEVTEIAESVGLGPRVAQEVLRVACRDAAAWNRLPLAGGDVGVAVTLSPRQLAWPGLAAAADAALADAGLSPALLTVRVDEEFLLADPELAAERFGELADLGLRVDVEGPGAGRAALGWISGFRVGGVVVPPVVLAGIGRDRQATAQIAGLVLLARSHDFDVTVDGVRHEDEARALAAVGCAHARGPYLGGWLEADAAAARIVAGLRPELRQPA